METLEQQITDLKTKIAKEVVIIAECKIVIKEAKTRLKQLEKLQAKVSEALKA